CRRHSEPEEQGGKPARFRGSHRRALRSKVKSGPTFSERLFHRLTSKVILQSSSILHPFPEGSVMKDRRRTSIRGERFLLPALLALGALTLSPVLPTQERTLGQTPDISGQIRETLLFKLDPNTPVKYLLPVPARVSRQV